MAGRNSSVKFNAFELASSSDVDRLQRLASRELQNILADEGRSDELRAAAGTAASPNSTPPDGIGNVINSARVLADLTPVPATLTMTLSVGEAYLNDASITGDDSPYQVVRWISQVLSFAGGAGNDRIDLVVATPAMVGADNQSRNILVDPATRTVQAQVVPKTENPQATITIVAGTAAANPQPPAVPAGAVALFEVYVPAGAAASTSFLVIRRIWRRVSYPLSAYNGILQGCVPQWSGTLDESASATLAIGALTSSGINRAVIDGEVISAPATLLPQIYQDAIANPFAGANPAADAPYYLYLCGGRNAPQQSFGSSPFILVESGTAPDIFGHPSAAMSVPTARGAIPRNAAIYVGVGFRIKSTAFRKGCLVDGDWVRAFSSATSVTGSFIPSFSETPTATAAAYNTGLTTRPAPSTASRIVFVSLGAGSILAMRGIAATNPTLLILSADTIAQADLPLIAAAGAELRVTPVGLGTFYPAACAYNMNVPRLSP